MSFSNRNLSFVIFFDYTIQKPSVVWPSLNFLNSLTFYWSIVFDVLSVLFDNNIKLLFTRAFRDMYRRKGMLCGLVHKTFSINWLSYFRAVFKIIFRVLGFSITSFSLVVWFMFGLNVLLWAFWKRLHFHLRFERLVQIRMEKNGSLLSNSLLSRTPVADFASAIEKNKGRQAGYTGANFWVTFNQCYSKHAEFLRILLHEFIKYVLFISNHFQKSWHYNPVFNEVTPTTWPRSIGNTYLNIFDVQFCSRL